MSIIPVESLGEAVLTVRMDSSAMQASLNNLQKGTTTALTSVERQTQQTTAKMAGSWREFVSQNLASYRQIEGSHKAAMTRLGAEWQTYRAQAVAANQAVAASAATASKATGASLATLKTGVTGALGSVNALAGRMTALFAGGLVAGGLLSLADSIGGLAAESDKAEKSTAAYGRALVRFRQDVGDGNAQVTRLAERFGVLDTTVQQASTTLLRNGASLKDVERALTAAGASAAAQGTSIESAFQNVAIALATGRSELLESSGIITNLGPVYQAYAKSVGKSVEQLTQAEKIQAGVNAVYKESRFEIEEIDNAMAGMAGTTANANRAAAEVRKELGEAFRPVVIEVQRAMTTLLTVTRDVIRVFNDYPGVLAGVTTAVLGLTGALLISKAGSLGAALAAIPGLAVAAGRAIAVAFGPYGVAAIAIATIVGLVAQVFSDIRKAEAQAAALKASHEKARSQQATVDEAQKELNRLLEGRKKLVDGLHGAEERYRNATDEWAKKRAAVEAREARDTIRLLDTEIGKQRELVAAKEKAAAAKPAPTAGKSDTDAYNEAKRLILAEANAKTAQAIANARNELEKFTKASGANKDAVDAVREALQREKQAASESERQTRQNTTATERAKTAAENFRDRLSDLTGAFRDSVKDGNVSASQVDSFRRSLNSLERDAKQAGVTLPKALLDSARALAAQGDAAARNADAVKDAADKAKAWGDNLAAIKYREYVAGLKEYSDETLKLALANAIAAKDVQKFNDVTAEQIQRLAAAAEAAARAGDALKNWQADKAANRNAQNLLNDIAASMEAGNPAKILAQLERLRRAMVAEWFGRLPADVQATLKAQEDTLSSALTGFGSRIYARSTPQVEKEAERWASRTTNAAGEAITTSTRHLVPKARAVAASIGEAISSSLPSDLSKAIAEGTALVSSEDFHKLPESLQKAIKDGLDRASKDYEAWAKSLGGSTVPYGKAAPVTLQSEILQAAKRAAVNAKAALAAGTLTGDSLAGFGADVDLAVSAAKARPELFTGDELQSIQEYAASLREIGDTFTRLKALNYEPGQLPKQPAPTQEELDRAERLAWLNGTTKYYSPAPKPEMLTTEELDRRDALTTAEGHIKYAGTGVAPVWAIAADDALQKVVDHLEEIAGNAGTEARLTLDEVERGLLQIEGMDFSEEAGLNLAVSFLESVLSGTSDQYIKDWAQELLDKANTALTAAEAGAWAEGTRKYAGLGQVYNPPLEPMDAVEARENARTAEMASKYAGTGQVYNPPLPVLATLDELREGYDLGAVSLAEYSRALEVEIGLLEEAGLKTQAARNEHARLKKELDELNSPLNTVTAGLAGVAEALAAIGDATSNEAISGLARLADEAAQLAPVLAKVIASGGADVAADIQAVVQIVTFLASEFSRAAREAEEFRQATKDLEKQVKFASLEVVSTVKIERGGFLGLGSKKVREVDDFALSVAQTIEGAIVNGISDGFSQAIARGDYSLVGEALEKSIGQAVLDGLIDAFVRGEIIKNIIQPALNQYIEARKTPGLEDDRAAIAGLKAAAGEAADASEAFYNDVYKPIAQEFDLYGSGGQPGSVADLRNQRGDLQSQFDLATSDSERRNLQSQIDNLDWQINQMTGSASGGGPFGVSMPGIGIQSAIATPILESAQSFKLSTDALGVHIGVFGAAANLFNTATARFDATITRLEQAAANGTAGLRYA